MPAATVTKKAVVVSKSYTLTYAYLKDFAFDRQCRILYKQFFKLRVFQEEPHDRRNYTTYIRRKFRYEDFNNRRSAFISEAGSKNTQNTLSNEDLIRRSINTLAFIHNACAFNATPENEKRIRADPKWGDEYTGPYEGTMESQILNTIINMEHDMPAEVKYDQKLHWLQSLETFVSQVDQVSGGDTDTSQTLTNSLSSAQVKKLFSRAEAELAYLGYKDYYETLMRLNEIHDLCL